MTDAISRSEAVKALTRIAMQVSKDKMRTVSRCVNEIEMLPALEAAPVVHARWVYSDTADADNNIDAYCSHCDAGDTHSVEKMHKVPYCWNCGARMDGDADA